MEVDFRISRKSYSEENNESLIPQFQETKNSKMTKTRGKTKMPKNTWLSKLPNNQFNFLYSNVYNTL